MPLTTLDHIERAAQKFAEAHADLGELAADLDQSMRDLKEQHMRRIRYAKDAWRRREQELKDLVSASPDLFERPRTHIFHGIKVGYQKGKGSIKIDDPDRTVELIKKVMPDAAESLIMTLEHPSKTELEKLSAVDLKKIACRIEGDGDFVVVKPADNDVNKMIKVLLAEKE